MTAPLRLGLHALRGIDLRPGGQYRVRVALSQDSGAGGATKRGVSDDGDDGKVLLTPILTIDPASARPALRRPAEGPTAIRRPGSLVLESPLWCELQSDATCGMTQVTVDLMFAEASTDAGAGSGAIFERVSRRVLLLGSGRSTPYHEYVSVVLDDEEHFASVNLELREGLEEQPLQSPRRVSSTRLGGWVLRDTANEPSLLRRFAKASASLRSGTLPRSKLSTLLLGPSASPDKLAADFGLELALPAAVQSGPLLETHREQQAQPVLLEQLGPVKSSEPSAKDRIDLDVLRSGPSNRLKSASSDMGGKGDARSGLHLVVVVPGYKGDADDVKLLRNHLAAVLPETHFYSPTVNCLHCNDLYRAGVRLSQEIASCIENLEKEAGCGLARLSFVAYATGGLIVRMALPWLREYDDRFSVLFTLSTPHLGLLPASLSLFRRLMFSLARTWFPDPMLETLALADARYSQEATLYRFTADATLEKFSSVVLTSLLEDSRFPHDSTSVPAPTDETTVDEQEVRRFGWRHCVAFLMAAFLFVACTCDTSSFSSRVFRLSSKEDGRTWARVARFGLLGLTLIWHRLRPFFKDESFLTSLSKMPRLVYDGASGKFIRRTGTSEAADSILDGMKNNMLTKFADALLVRVEVDFGASTSTTAHSQLLESKDFARTLACAYGVLFE